VTPPPPLLPNINKHDHSLSPQKPKKRARGGGPRSRGGWGSRGGRGGAGRGSAAKSDDPVKETEDPSAVDGKGNNMADKIEIIEDDEVFANTRWTDDERTMLFEYYLGPESDDIFEKLKNNVTYAHKKVRFSIYSCDISLF
jgi:hypothetical protein